jgi:hypothetical protein
MSTLGKTTITYLDAFAAISRLITNEEMSHVCVMEFEGGIIVTGSKLYTVGERINRHMVTHVLSNDDIQRLIKEK